MSGDFLNSFTFNNHAGAAKSLNRPVFRMFSKCTHVIFDMDGLLINTEDLYTEAFQAVLDEFDVTYTFEMKAKIMGSKPQEWSRAIIAEYGLVDKITPDEFISKCEGQYPRFFPQAKLLPGVQERVQHTS